MVNAAEIKMRDAEALAAGYSMHHRIIEVLSMVAALLLCGTLVYRVYMVSAGYGLVIALTAFASYALADVFSGLVHWSADTWGTADTPIFGPALIRPFREHHVDQLSITRHDFLEANGNSCLALVPVATLAQFIPISASSPFWIVFMTFCAVLFITLGFTNEIHKRAHEENPPFIFATLQKMHLILPPAHHQVHHTSPFEKYYCITHGWMNPFLTRIGFFPFLEQIITSVTGWVPREDDIGREAAMKLAKEIGITGMKSEGACKSVGDRCDSSISTVSRS
jgi:ubiquitin-conjugating enzyme E2 variant